MSTIFAVHSPWVLHLYIGKEEVMENELVPLSVFVVFVGKIADLTLYAKRIRYESIQGGRRYKEYSDQMAEREKLSKQMDYFDHELKKRRIISFINDLTLNSVLIP